MKGQCRTMKRLIGGIGVLTIAVGTAHAWSLQAPMIDPISQKQVGQYALAYGQNVNDPNARAEFHIGCDDFDQPRIVLYTNRFADTDRMHDARIEYRVINETGETFGKSNSFAVVIPGGPARLILEKIAASKGGELALRATPTTGYAKQVAAKVTTGSLMAAFARMKKNCLRPAQ
jgi:hypothetical protein